MTTYQSGTCDGRKWIPAKSHATVKAARKHAAKIGGRVARITLEFVKPNEVR